MKRRDLIKCLTILPIAEFSPLNYQGNLSFDEFGSLLSTALFKSTDSDLHSNAFVMDGHIHMMSRQLLQGLDIGVRYADGHVDLPRAKDGGLDAMFFSCYTPEPYYPDRHEVKNTFRVIELFHR